MRSRRRLSTAAFAALAGMLFLQAAIAFAPCDLPCHEPDQDQALCIAHCGAQGQTVAKAQLHVPDLATHPATPLRVAPQRPLLAAQDRAAPGAAAGPPARILFQSFLL